ncbi:MAG: HNH endonuclease signature motif containing protein [Lachnospiraceae bacterium]
MNDKHQFFAGRMFTRDEQTGYYLCSAKSTDGSRKRLHVYVWEFYNGPVPRGYHVHHRDEDKSNNDISNLELLSESDHLSLHGKEQADRHYERMVDNLNRHARPKANEWHASTKGREWHREHYEAMKEKLYIPRKYICENCGKHYESVKAGSRFCSSNCRAAWRRNSGADDVIKICVDCGVEYKANKYAKTKFCPICKNNRHSRRRKSGCLQYGS